MTKAKKLPDVPIMFSTDGRPFVSAVAIPTAGMRVGVRYRYTPAKPAKVCKCKEPFSGPLCLYCANCGGKVKR